MYGLPAIKKSGSLFFPFIALLLTAKTTLAGNFFAGCAFHDSIVVMILQCKKPVAFELYPDAAQSVLLFAAKGEKGKVFGLFLFDMEGRLIRQTQVHSKETTLLSGLAKGDYIFDILIDDERIGNGNIAIR